MQAAPGRTTDHQALLVLPSQDVQAAVVGVGKKCRSEERRVKCEPCPTAGHTPVAK